MNKILYLFIMIAGIISAQEEKMTDSNISKFFTIHMRNMVQYQKLLPQNSL
ncbi:MAG: hypothetical protein ACPKPY_10000 [Nitrososphaeraceae archaeon]